MSIISINTNVTGQIGDSFSPHRVTLVTTDTYNTIVKPGYLNNAIFQGYEFGTNDIVNVIYNYNVHTESGDSALFTINRDYSTHSLYMSPFLLPSEDYLLKSGGTM